MTKLPETLQKLHTFFLENDDLRIFAMSGSRLNRKISDDKFKDWDVIFFTENIEKYKQDKQFLEKFGETLLITEPDGVGHFYELTYPEMDGYTYLVQYKSGLRIDFQFMKCARLEKYFAEDSLAKIILDKDGNAPSRIPDDKAYWIKPPAPEELNYSIKEFYWQFLNTLKANLRGEFLLAQFYLNLTRKECIRLMTWSIADKRGFAHNYGKENTALFQFLEKSDAALLEKSFNSASNEKINQSLKILAKLEKKQIDEHSHRLFFSDLDFSGYENIPNDYLISKDEKTLAEYFKISDGK